MHFLLTPETGYTRFSIGYTNKVGINKTLVKQQHRDGMGSEPFRSFLMGYGACVINEDVSLVCESNTVASPHGSLSACDVALLASSGAAAEYGWATGEATIIMHLQKLGLSDSTASLVRNRRSNLKLVDR